MHTFLIPRTHLRYVEDEIKRVVRSVKRDVEYRKLSIAQPSAVAGLLPDHDIDPDLTGDVVLITGIPADATVAELSNHQHAAATAIAASA